VDIAEALTRLAESAWSQFIFRDDSEILGVVYVRYFDDSADVVVLYSEEHARTYRANISSSHGDETTPFVPDSVSWFYEGEAARAIEALFRLPEPGQPHAPAQVHRFPGTACVPQEWLREKMEVARKGQVTPETD
jgi:hypothetical protein